MFLCSVCQQRLIALVLGFFFLAHLTCVALHYICYNIIKAVTNVMKQKGSHFPRSNCNRLCVWINISVKIRGTVSGEVEAVLHQMEVKHEAVLE